MFCLHRGLPNWSSDLTRLGPRTEQPA